MKINYEQPKEEKGIKHYQKHRLIANIIAIILMVLLLYTSYQNLQVKSEIMEAANVCRAYEIDDQQEIIRICDLDLIRSVTGKKKNIELEYPINIDIGMD